MTTKYELVTKDNHCSPRPVPVVVVGSNGANALGVLRSLGRRGIPVYAASIGSHHIVRRSRYCRGVINIDEARNSNALAKTMLQFAHRIGERPVLICCSDLAIHRMASIATLLAQEYRPITDPLRAAALEDKKFQLSLAKKAGIPVPDTWILACPDDLEKFVDHFSYPAICKPTSAANRGGFIWKTLILETPEQARQLLAEPLQSQDIELMVQHYVPGTPDRIEICLAACDSSGNPQAWCTGKKIRQSTCETGIMTCGEVIDLPSVTKAGKQFFQQTGLGGLIGLEFKRNPETGKLLFIEMNARSENIISMASAAGVDLPYYAYLITLGKMPTTIRQRFHVKWILEIPDFLAAIRLIKAGRLTWRKYLYSLKGRRTWGIFAWSDPLPFMATLVTSMIRMVRKQWCWAAGKIKKGMKKRVI